MAFNITKIKKIKKTKKEKFLSKNNMINLESFCYKNLRKETS